MVPADYFDGYSTRVRPVDLTIEDAELRIVGEGVDRREPLAATRIDERFGSAPRKLRFPDGSFCEVRDLAGLDALLSSARRGDGWVDRLSHRRRYVLAACAAFLALAAAGYRWGLPWIAAAGARHLPPAVGRALSRRTLAALDGGVLLPSAIDLRRRRRLSKEFRALHLPDGGTPATDLLFRRSPALGANAFTLPDGTIVVLDGLVDTLGDDREILAVLAHELGHAHGRHGLQLLLRSSVIGAFLTFYLGDASQILAAAPATVLQARYSQDLERQADDYGAAVLVANGMSPGLLADALQKLTAARGRGGGPGFLASHPPTQRRMRRLRSLAAAYARGSIRHR